MNFILAVLASALLWTPPHWLTDFGSAKKEAQEKHKMMLLNFSGSDWCGPCIRMHQEVFDTAPFEQLADSSLVLVQADFPRQKKHRLPDALVQHNEALAAQYNPEGTFPLTVLLDEKGNVVKRWEGYPAGGASHFIADLNTLVHAAR